MSLQMDFGRGTQQFDSLNASLINSYARVTAITSDSATIILQQAVLGNYERFAAGTEILFHVSASTGTAYTEFLGCWGLAKIVSVSGDVLTLDADLTKIIPASEVTHYYCQAITVAHFDNVTLASGTTIRPQNYSATNFHGGIVAMKVSGSLDFRGGHIDLSDAGIPLASKNLRPVTPLEANATKDTDLYAGWENFDTKEHFTLQAGDGSAFIAAKHLTCHADSRIGNINSHGAAFCRGSSNSVGSVPSNVGNVGGSSIFIAADTITDFTPSILSKYRSGTAGQGICRCYIATDSILPNDEGLYSYDILRKPSRITQELNIKNFGEGTLGDLSESTVQLNNYATVTGFSADRKKVSYTGKTTAGLAQISTGALVMIHLNHKTASEVAQSGRFFLAKVLADNGSDLTLNVAIPDDFDATKYAAQIVSVAQANNFTLTKENKATPKFDGKQGGILALAVKNQCNLSGKLNVEGKGGGTAYGAEGLKYISNSGLRDRLPIGQGHGSVFLLAKTLTLTTAARIGATYTGDALGGKAASGKAGGGYRGNAGAGRGYNGSGGSGAAGGKDSYKHAGGYGSNSSSGACQGAHILVVAGKLNDFTVAAISTGGAKGTQGKNQLTGGGNGGAGYGGGGASAHAQKGQGIAGSGGYNGGGGGAKCNSCTNSWGGGGGSSGWAFIYVASHS